MQATPVGAFLIEYLAHNGTEYFIDSVDEQIYYEKIYKQAPFLLHATVECLSYSQF